MKTGNNTTYSLLMQSEGTGRGLMETMVYALLALSVMVSILQFAVSPITALKIQAGEVSRVSQHRLEAVVVRKS